MKRLWLLPLAAIAFTACKKDEPDTTAPTISISTPTNEQKVAIGGSFKLSGTISDDMELASYQVDIHEAEGHSHDHKSGDHDHSEEWEVKKNFNITGTSHTVDVNFGVPSNAEKGEYHVIINALDKAGNAATFVEITIDVE